MARTRRMQSPQDVGAGQASAHDRFNHDRSRERVARLKPRRGGARAEWRQRPIAQSWAL